MFRALLQTITGGEAEAGSLAAHQRRAEVLQTALTEALSSAAQLRVRTEVLEATLADADAQLQQAALEWEKCSDGARVREDELLGEIASSMKNNADQRMQLKTIARDLVEERMKATRAAEGRPFWLGRIPTPRDTVSHPAAEYWDQADDVRYELMGGLAATRGVGLPKRRQKRQKKESGKRSWFESSRTAKVGVNGMAVSRTG